MNYMTTFFLKYFSLMVVISCLIISNNVQAQDKLLQSNDMFYIGSFRVPLGDLGGPLYHGLSYGGEVIAYNQTNNSLFITGHTSDQLIAEISIPSLVNSTNVANLNRAIALQNLTDMAEGNLLKITEDGLTNHAYAKYGGLLKYGNKWIAGVYSRYDAGYVAHFTHFTSSDTLTATGDFSGMMKVGAEPDPVPQAGYIGGYMTPIPTNWQAKLGGKVLSGMSAISIISRTSAGSSAFAFDPENLSTQSTAPATALLYYPPEHQTIGTFYTSGTLYNQGTHHAGVVFPSGTRSVLYVGRQGLGTACYGQGTADINEVGNLSTNPPPDNVCNGTVMTDSHPCCYDPVNTTKGTHAYPYADYIWAYDAEDLERVKNGGRVVDNPSPNLVDGVSPSSTDTYEPWFIKPYAHWAINYPFSSTRFLRNGATAYDETNRILYISQPAADGDLPIIHAYKLNINSPVITTIKLN